MKKNTKLTELTKGFTDFGLRMQDDAITAYAGESSLYIIISFFPFIMFLLTLFKYLPFNEHDLINLIDMNLPELLANPVKTIINEIYNKSGGTLMSITIISAIWSSSRGMLTVIRGLNSVYHIRETRNYFIVRGKATLDMLVFTLVIIITLGLVVFGGTIVNAFNSYLPGVLTSFLTLIKMRQFITVAFLVFFFAVFYTVVPNRKTKLVYELPGAIITALGWTVFSFAYSFYIENMSNFTYMYGSLTAVVLLLVWLYFCFYILFFGAEVNVLLQENFPRFFQRLSKKKRQTEPAENNM